MMPQRDPLSDDAASGTVPDDKVAEACERQLSHIGGKVRALRRNRMTLAQLAAASGVSIGLLSRLENGVGNPSFSVLGAVARALEIDISSFFDEMEDAGSVVPRQRRIGLTMPHSDVQVEMLVESFDSPIFASLLALPPRSQPSSRAQESPGSIFEYVLAGTVEYRIDFESHVLHAGDTILFDGSRSHARGNPDDAVTAKILSCSSRVTLQSFFA